MTAPAVKLRITEVFASIQGESTWVGLPTVFVRLTGCPLRCSWCDTAYAFTGGESRSLDEVLADVARHGLKHVCVTGGEPLSQKGCLPLLSALCDAGYAVSLETSGALDIGAVDPRVSRIMDLKAPGSGEVERNLYDNIAHLKADDELKIVIANTDDYAWAKQQIATHRLAERCTVLLSPVAGEIDPAQLAEWIVRDRLPVRFQLQLHKILWNDARGR
ncbi:MAG: 7-carboxy-7-deazaguanine synthase QueE [Thauera propionica]|jgi:7-carboxy-7-deazaguanine synthase|uniref:7-carboxy-7-deazaguanine synthase n=1 Tax=Thauera propionica TaxID=2019431 RepID=A0A235F267_9RHOO|nr:MULTISPECIES: 7-carboxy-7-deazaguanine synthase QueE [Thauera]MDD3677490.1 7-carboxy-7-deazaguanine synthase QueE [Thauera propionica]MDY0047688.1 7-carboxy-7-deazaguanine synthase QueE [Thauera propionica]OYD55123.1 7-carboxy-7-deazaguanine synthase QueE [Thauera propionica]